MTPRDRERRAHPAGWHRRTSLQPRPRRDPGVRGAALGRASPSPGGRRSFPFYYMVRALGPQPIERSCCDPGAAVAPPEFTFEHLRAGARRPWTTAARASWCSCATARSSPWSRWCSRCWSAIPGAYAVSRLRFFGRRQVSALFLAVYLFPAILLAIPLFVIFTAARAARLAGRAGHRVHRADRAGVDLHAAQLLRDGPGEPWRRPRRSTGASRSRSSAGSACRWRRPRSWRRPVRLHDRLERVPVRAALPGREPRRVDGVARVCPSSPAASRCRRRC